MNFWSKLLKRDRGVDERLKENSGDPSSDDDSEQESVFDYLGLRNRKLSSAIRIGDIPVADLKIVRELGHGTSSTVYKVRHDVSPKDHRTYAMKILEIQMQSCFKPALEHIKNEIDILRRLVKNSNSKSVNPLIVKMIEALVDSNLRIYCILFEYVNGGTLDDIVKKRKRINETDLGWIARKLLLALHYLRDNRIAHLDLKPANILMNRAGDDLKLADFGASVFIDESRSVESYDLTVGSPRYMSPERFEGSCIVLKHPSEIMASDIWSLGVCMLECCGTSDIINASMIVMGIVPSIPADYGASQELKDFVSICLTTDPSLRPTPSQLLCHPFILKSKESHRLNASPSPPPSRSRSRSLPRLQCRSNRNR